MTTENKKSIYGLFGHNYSSRGIDFSQNYKENNPLDKLLELYNTTEQVINNKPGDSNLKNIGRALREAISNANEIKQLFQNNLFDNLQPVKL